MNTKTEATYKTIMRKTLIAEIAHFNKELEDMERLHRIREKNLKALLKQEQDKLAKIDSDLLRKL